MILNKNIHRLLSIHLSVYRFMVLIVLFTSCSENNDTPKDILSFDKMKLILWDDTKAQVYAKEILSRDSAINDTIWYAAMKDKILQHHHITKELYEKSYRYYSMHPELFIRLTDSIIKMQSEIPNKTNLRKPAFFQNSKLKNLKEYE